MGIYSIGTEKYEADISYLLKRRLEKLGCDILPEGDNTFAWAEVSGAVQMEEWCAALAELLLMDLAQFEIAYMVNDLPISLEEKKAVLAEAIRLARRSAGMGAVQGGLVEYFAENEHLQLEGYMDFRMKEYRREWERAVLKAADELLLDAEYMEFMRVLAAFIKLRSPQTGDIYVILNPDGSCTFTDDKDIRIDYERCTEDGIMSVLVGLAPESITVYDLSGGRCASLFDSLKRVFEGRVRFFK